MGRCVILAVTRELIYALGLENVPVLKLPFHPALAGDPPIPFDALVENFRKIGPGGEIWEFKLSHPTFPETPAGELYPRVVAVATPEAAEPDVVIDGGKDADSYKLNPVTTRA